MVFMDVVHTFEKKQAHGVLLNKNQSSSFPKRLILILHTKIYLERFLKNDSFIH